MTKSELISRVSEQVPKMAKADVEVIINEIFQTLTHALAVRGDRVEIRGFGTFKVSQRRPREGRNPRTGEVIQIPARQAVDFRVGKELYDRINQDTL